MKLRIFALLLLASIAYAADEPTAAKHELDRIWTEYQTKLTESLKPHQDTYLRGLEKLEWDAIRNNDAIAAAAIRAERDSSDLGLVPLALPAKKTNAQITEFRRLRAEFERKREEALRTLNAWSRGELERVERTFLRQSDPVSAAAVRIECDAVSKPPLQIVKALYGVGTAVVDVSVPLRKAIRFNRIETAGGNSLAGDPAPFQRKGGFVTYRFGGGRETSVRFGESGTIEIP